MIRSIIKKLLAAALIIGLLSPSIALAQIADGAMPVTSNGAAAGTQTVLGEVSNFGEFISLIWSYGSQVIISLAVFFIILGAFFYMASAGNEERISQGKQMIFGSFVAIFIVIFSGVLIRTLHKPAEGTAGYLSDVPDVIYNATSILTGIIGAFAIFMFVYAGLTYALSRGDSEKVRKAHSALQYAVFGLVVGVLAYALVNNVVNYFL